MENPTKDVIIMSMNSGWQTFGHAQNKSLLDRQISCGSLPHAYLFSGNEGLGKFFLAKEFAAKILEGAHLISHPDYLELDASEDFGIEEVRVFLSKLSGKPFAAKKRVAIINNAHLLNRQSANALLKTIEEPSLSTVLILVGNSVQMLPTIRSRCLILNFSPLSKSELTSFAKAKGLKSSPEVLNLSFGSPASLKEFSENDKVYQEAALTEKWWSNLKKLGAGEKFARIGEISEKETAELLSLTEFLIRLEQQSLNSNPKNYFRVRALSEAWESFLTNQNKKSILQELFLKI